MYVNMYFSMLSITPMPMPCQSCPIPSHPFHWDTAPSNASATTSDDQTQIKPSQIVLIPFVHSFILFLFFIFYLWNIVITWCVYIMNAEFEWNFKKENDFFFFVFVHLCLWICIYYTKLIFHVFCITRYV